MGQGSDIGSEPRPNADYMECYAIGSYWSNAWQSSNPYSGVYRATVAKTLDALNCGYPGCQQGGTLIIEVYHDKKSLE